MFNWYDGRGTSIPHKFRKVPHSRDGSRKTHCCALVQNRSLNPFISFILNGLPPNIIDPKVYVSQLWGHFGEGVVGHHFCIFHRVDVVFNLYACVRECMCVRARACVCVCYFPHFPQPNVISGITPGTLWRGGRATRWTCIPAKALQ